MLRSTTLPGDGTVYRLVARHSGKVADVRGGTANGTQVVQWPWSGSAHQRWTFASTGDGYFTVRGVGSGRLLEIGGLSRAEGGAAGIWDAADAPQQQWALTPTGDGHHFLTNRLSGLALDVSGGLTDDGTALDQRTYTAAARQQWRIVPV